MNIATWNVNSLKVRLPQVIAWLEEHRIDALCLQELKMTDENFPLQAFQDIGYQAVFTGQKTYNGVAIISKQVGVDSIKNLPNFEDPQQRVITTTLEFANKKLRLINAYCPNGQAPDSDKFTYKLAWFDAFTHFIAQQQENHEHVVVVGDFNIAPEDRDVHDPSKWEGQNLVTPEERAAFKRILDLGFSDAFRLFEQEDKLYSWWDYRQFSFRRNAGLRIDHILISQSLTPYAQQCWVDKQVRKNEQPSDHAPVIIELMQH